MPGGVSGYPGFSADMERGTTHIKPSLKNDEATFRGGHKGKGGVVGTPSNLGGGSLPITPSLGGGTAKFKRKRK